MNTDHATIVIDLDFTSSSREKGTFQSPPNAHNDPIYTRLIKNTIKTAIYSCIKPDKNTDLEIGLLESRIMLEEELHQIETTIPNWNTKTRQNTLRHTIAHLLSNELTNAILIDRDLTISKPNLLEFILQKMKEDNNLLQKNKNKNNFKEGTRLKEKLQDLISDNETDENTILIYETQQQLEDHENKLIYDTLSKKASFNLLENERASRTFLNMESSKSGYSEITKLRIPNPQFNNLQPQSAENMSHFTITNNDLVRYNMTTAFQTIFEQQPNLANSKQDIIDFLNSDGDTKPLEELNKRKITPNNAQKMEGLLTLQELTSALLKGASSPGIDGFIVNHLHTFWDDLSPLQLWW